MPRIFITALTAAALLLLACGGSDDGNVIRVREEDLTPDVPVTVQTAVPTQAPAATPTGGELAEVQGIVGAIDEAAQTISITRLQGASVDTVRAGASTRITGAGGRELTLADLRPSDRIVATGTLEEGILVASEITVGQVVPGTDPGG
jgi:hypothetical protein